MSRHLYFRDDRYISIGGVLYNIPDLFLGIITAVPGIIVAFPRMMTNNSSIPAATFLCKQRVLFYFNTPTLILRKVPVEIVHFVEGYKIDIFFDKINLKKMPAAIQHKTPVFK